MKAVKIRYGHYQTLEIMLIEDDMSDAELTIVHQSEIGFYPLLLNYPHVA